MTENITSKQKGDLLEKIVEKLCGDFRNAKVSRDVKIKGKSGVNRQIDVLIEATYQSFDVKIVVEAKNFSSKVDIDIVESLKTKLNDIGGNLGVIVCPLGFTEGAIKSAKLNDIQLCQVFDNKLGNTNEFLPLRYVVPFMKKYAPQIKGGAMNSGGFEISTDTEKWKFFINNKWLNLKQAITYAWNRDMFPKVEGHQVANFGAVRICSGEDTSKFYYAEFKLNVLISADYYLKLFPASYMQNIKSEKGNHQLNIDIYSKKEDMIKNGWKHFDTREAMNEAAQLVDTFKYAKDLIMAEDYTLGDL